MKIHAEIEKTLSVMFEMGDHVVLHPSVLTIWPQLNHAYTVSSIYTKDNGLTYYDLIPIRRGLHSVSGALDHQLIKVPKNTSYEDRRGY
jgi:uncharacterized membrane-anchored protein